MDLDQELRRLRKEKGITQEYLANELYVSIQTINKWENGKCLPDAINLLHIAQFYEISLDDLMKNEVPKSLSKEKRKKHRLIPLSITDIFSRINL
ncbi:TPA: helix-turn-helix transcriptional regulator [Staphylococcus pseudintermedius]|uniref:helix-turn-helix transcriptional regulator n=1 Tax=Staphylococcus sp. HMSC62B09 TaxID=1608884 RepID=UPI0008A97DD3|nr:helix-turn-helix transcriptional regulator [Staphylococcus sp. HMSC62B09]HAR5874407.1 helix-turn-helix transcriptional regulator [Staphylococcus pseudintermedius]HAR5933055.1 helix-turn-helix transcriptional regulator [Staphylococcus pseudintermedius]